MWLNEQNCRKNVNLGIYDDDQRRLSSLGASICLLSATRADGLSDLTD